MKNVLEKGRITAGQDVLETLINQLKMLGTPPLGPEFAKIGGTFLTDSLVIHRLTAKFERPIGKSDTKKRASIQKMLDYDKTYLEVQKGLFKQSKSVSRFYSARAWMHTTLRGFKPSMKVEFPKGESVIDSGGFVNLFYKLTRSSQWTVSRDCVNDAANIAYNNRALKRVVIDRYRALYPGELDMRRGYAKVALKLNKNVGLYVFRRVFRKVVNIVSVSRLNTVPKNNKEDRVITHEPTWNIIVQRSIALGILKCVRDATGVDIQQLQAVHHVYIRDRQNATIDFSKASDSNWFNIFKLLWPKKIVDAVERARTGLCEYEDDYYKMNQLAPMGCGYTFEIMSVTLMALARVLDPYATVFGDDVIINKKSAKAFIKLTTGLGWVVNEEKSFIDGNFSESCGAFYNHSTKEYIVSNDLFFPETMADIIAAGNKLSRILRANQVSALVRERLLKAYASLVCIIPSVAHTWDRLQDGEEASRLWVPKSIPLDSFRPKNAPNYSEDYLKDNNFGKRLVYKPTIDIPVRDTANNSALYALYMYSGVQAIGPRRGTWIWESYLR